MSKTGNMNNLFIFCDRCGVTVKKEDIKAFIKMGTSGNVIDKLCPECFDYQKDCTLNNTHAKTNLDDGKKDVSLLIFDDDDDVEKKFMGIYDNVGFKELFGLNNETKLFTWLCATRSESFDSNCHHCNSARFAFKIEHKMPLGKGIQEIPFHTEIMRPDFCVECSNFPRSHLVQWFHDIYQEKAQEYLNLFMKRHESLFKIKGMKKLK